MDWKISPVLDVLLEIPELYDHFSGEHSESAEGIYDISNKQRLGLTEYQAVKQVKDFEKKKSIITNSFQMYDGVKKLIELEKAAN